MWNGKKQNKYLDIITILIVSGFVNQTSFPILSYLISLHHVNETLPRNPIVPHLKSSKNLLVLLDIDSNMSNHLKESWMGHVKVEVKSPN